jgi:hypothetical protein
MFGRKKSPRDALAATARVARMAPTEKTARRPDKLDGEYEFTLEVDVAGRAPFEAHIVEVVPHEKLVAAGQRVPVFASASDPAQVTIDFDNVPDAGDRAAAAAAAAERGNASAVAEALGFKLADPTDSA